MKKLSFVIGILFAANVFAGQDGGGGDAVYCDAHGDRFPKDGYYVLDYIVANGNQTWANKAGEIEQLEYLLDIATYKGKDDPNKLGQYFPGLKRGFQEFIEYYRDKLTGSEKHWVPADLPLIDIPDEQLPEHYQLPANCNSKLQQAAIRIKYARYYFDRSIEEELKDTDHGLQLNVRNLHEMLREFYSDSRLIRAWVSLLMQPNLLELVSEVRIDQTLVDYGIFEDDEYALTWKLSIGIGEISQRQYLYRTADSQLVRTRLNIYKLQEKNKYIQGYIPNSDEIKLLESVRNDFLLPRREILIDHFAVADVFIKRLIEEKFWSRRSNIVELPAGRECKYWRLTVEEAAICHKEKFYNPTLEKMDSVLEFVNLLLSRRP